MRPLFLISNDDGYQAKGICSLVDYLRDMGDIVVCAPTGARSGYSKAVTADTELTVSIIDKKEGLQIWACTGSPVDCIKIALKAICPRKPDLVIGGINHGDNSGFNAHFSATVGLVSEGCLRGIPSIAFSLCDYELNADFSVMRTIVRDIVSETMEKGLPSKTCLNVNVPKGGATNGIKYCRMAMGYWDNDIVDLREEDGEKKFKVSFYHYRNVEKDDVAFDSWALVHGYASITPLTLDLTAWKYIRENYNLTI